MSTKNLPARHQAIRNEIRARSLDEVVAAHTAFDNFEGLVQESLRTGYRPSLYTKPKGKALYHYRSAEMALRIAEAFDYEMAKQGSSTRCFYGNEEQPKQVPDKNPEPRISFMTHESKGWGRAWAILALYYDPAYIDTRTGEVWEYVGSSCGAHEFRHRAYDGKRTIFTVPVVPGDFDQVVKMPAEIPSRFERI
jgi:hypothetical protein